MPTVACWFAVVTKNGDMAVGLGGDGWAKGICYSARSQRGEGWPVGVRDREGRGWRAGRLSAASSLFFADGVATGANGHKLQDKTVKVAALLSVQCE